MSRMRIVWASTRLATRSHYGYCYKILLNTSASRRDRRLNPILIRDSGDSYCRNVKPGVAPICIPRTFYSRLQRILTCTNQAHNHETVVCFSSVTKMIIKTILHNCRNITTETLIIRNIYKIFNNNIWAIKKL